MDQTDFAIVMVSGVLIIIAIFLFILFKIFGKKKKKWPIVTLLPETIKKEPHGSQPEKFVIRPLEIEGLEKEFQMARDLQKMEPVKEIIMERKEDIPSNEPGKTMVSFNETVQIQKETKKEPLKVSAGPKKEEPFPLHFMQSIEDNEKLKLEDILIESRDENSQKKAKKKRSLGRNLENADKLKEKESPEKKPMKRPFRKKSEKDQVPEHVLKVPEEKSHGKKPGKKVSAKKKKQAIVTENPGSGEL